MLLLAVAVIILIVMALALVRAFAGPSIYDRILAVNVFGTKTVLMISVVAYFAGRPDFLDISLAYALINFITVVAVLKFFEYGDFARSREGGAGEDAP